ncbi:MAG TPA: DsbA family oxidoreductase [Steroidobacteraceae bacterium]|nr:DsbA family oxidoreductase [Steroidobacteraceae bacterium]
MKIDFVSDVSCPWCVIGLKGLEAALAKLPDLAVELHFQPFELNPQMPLGGEDIAAHVARKYGGEPADFARNQEMIRARGAELGFTFNMDKRTRIYNTFDAHRLLHWAEIEGRQHELKNALFVAYFTHGRDPGDYAVLVDAAREAGLDPARAQQVLASGEYATEVREREEHYRRLGISAVPSIIINDRHLIQGGQPPEVFEQALRQLAGSAG